MKVNGKQIEFYDSIDDMPIVKFHRFNKMMLIDSGIGSDLTDITDHIEKIGRYIELNDKQNGKQQLNNLRQSLYMVSNELNVKHLSLMVMIKTIDGKEMKDISTKNLEKLLKMFENKKKSWFEDMVENLKKKIKKN